MMRMVRWQFIRYVLVGIGLCAAGYPAYLSLTWWIIGGEAAMTIIFSIGTLLGFLANRSFTFRHRGDQLAPLRRFLTCYTVVYLLDVIALWVVAGQMGVLHQIVQGCMILLVALLTFMMHKHWVSSGAAGTMGESATRIS
jgi:putative flippase GtrA